MGTTADHVPESDVREQDVLVAQHRAVKVLRLAKGPHTGELGRDPDRIHAKIVSLSLCSLHVYLPSTPKPQLTVTLSFSLDVILRAETVERAKAGDKCTFTGTFIVVPDVSQMSMPGVSAEMQKESRGGGRGEAGVASQGVSGLKETGVRDLGYKTAFLACMAENSDARVSLSSKRVNGEEAGLT